MKKLIWTVLLMLSSIGCTQQDMAKNWGGNATLTLPAGTKLMNVTWKNTELWYLTRPRLPGEKIETYTFAEQSSFGMIEGTITIQER